MATMVAIPALRMASKVAVCLTDVKMSAERLEHQLRELIGDSEYLALVDAFAGRRIFIPQSAQASNLLTPVLSATAIETLSDHWCGLHLNIPLSREFRARHYRRQGMSNGAIAHRLGITESAVNRIFRRLEEALRRSTRASNDNRRIRLIKAAGME